MKILKMNTSENIQQDKQIKAFLTEYSETNKEPDFAALKHYLDVSYDFLSKHPILGAYLIYTEEDLSKIIGVAFLNPIMDPIGYTEYSVGFLPSSPKGVGGETITEIKEIIDTNIGKVFQTISVKDEGRIEIENHELKGALLNINVTNIPSIVCHGRELYSGRVVDYFQGILNDGFNDGILHGIQMVYPYQENINIFQPMLGPDEEIYNPGKSKMIDQVQCFFKAFHQRQMPTKSIVDDWQTVFGDLVKQHKNGQYGETKLIHLSWNAQINDKVFFPKIREKAILEFAKDYNDSRPKAEENGYGPFALVPYNDIQSDLTGESIEALLYESSF